MIIAEKPSKVEFKDQAEYRFLYVHRLADDREAQRYKLLSDCGLLSAARQVPHLLLPGTEHPDYALEPKRLLPAEQCSDPLAENVLFHAVSQLLDMYRSMFRWSIYGIFQPEDFLLTEDAAKVENPLRVNGLRRLSFRALDETPKKSFGNQLKDSLNNLLFSLRPFQTFPRSADLKEALKAEPGDSYVMDEREEFDCYTAGLEKAFQDYQRFIRNDRRINQINIILVHAGRNDNSVPAALEQLRQIRSLDSCPAPDNDYRYCISHIYDWNNICRRENLDQFFYFRRYVSGEVRSGLVLRELNRCLAQLLQKAEPGQRNLIVLDFSGYQKQAGRWASVVDLELSIMNKTIQSASNTKYVAYVPDLNPLEGSLHLPEGTQSTQIRQLQKQVDQIWDEWIQCGSQQHSSDD